MNTKYEFKATSMILRVLIIGSGVCWGLFLTCAWSLVSVSAV